MVSARRLIGAAIVVSAVVAVGCASRPRGGGPAATPSARARSSKIEIAGKSARPVATVKGSAPVFEPVGPEVAGEPSEVATKSLAQHSERYAKNLETLLTRRGDTHQADSTIDPATDTTTFSTLPPPASNGSEVDNAQANTGMQIPPAPPEGAVRLLPLHEPPRKEPTAVAEDVSPRPQPPPQPGNPPEPVAAEPAAAKAAAKAPAVSSNDLLQKLSAQVKADPRDAVSHLNYQLLQYLLDEQVPELSSIAPLPAEDRELLTTLLDGLTNFRNGLRAEANSLQSKKVAPLLELADRLRSQGELSLSTAALCRSVARFGVYDPMDPPRFVSGKKDNDAILYCEVANFSSQLNEKKLWETKLKQEAVLYSESGLAVWSDKSDTVIDQSRNRLHDFFIADKVRLPPSLPIGRYLMKMTVTDLHANRVAEATVPIQVVAQ